MRRIDLVFNSSLESSNQSDVDGAAAAEAELRRGIQRFRKLLLRIKASEIHRKGASIGVKEEALKVANLLVKATNQRSLPIDVDFVCRKMRIHTVVDNPRPACFPAELVPDKAGFVLRIEETGNEVRRRATIAHEIGHTLFYDATSSPPTKLLRYKPRTASEDKEEWIAWDFARELLLPRTLFMNEFSSMEYPLPLSDMVDFARKVGVSVEILCHRLIHDFGLWDPCALLVSDVQNGSLSRDAKTYRTLCFPRFPLKGKKGLISSSPKFMEIATKACRSSTKYCSGFFEFRGIQLWAKLLIYSANPQRALCLLELPFHSCK